MHTVTRSRVLAAAIGVPLVIGLTACSENDKKKANQVASSPCPSSISATASASLPSDVPAPAGSGTAYLSSAQGKTRVWFFAVDGSPDSLSTLRDTYDDALKAKGYDIKGTDQEDGAEAESEFSGPHDGTTNFRPLCTGKVVLRLKLES